VCIDGYSHAMPWALARGIHYRVLHRELQRTRRSRCRFSEPERRGRYLLAVAGGLWLAAENRRYQRRKQGRERVRGTLCATGGVLPLISRASDSDSESGMADDTKQKAAVRQAQNPRRTLEKCRSGTTTRHVRCAALPPLTPAGGRHRRKPAQDSAPPPSVTWLNPARSRAARKPQHG
jgi:hypothetical protein